jgi:transposase
MEPSDNAHALLGMEGFVVLATTEEAGELHVLVETTRARTGCPSCGVIATGHGRSVVQVRDLPIGGRPLRLVWRKRRWVCLEDECDTKSFTEKSELVEGALTRRAAEEICRRVGRDGHAVAAVARDLGVSWASAMSAVRRHGEPLVEDPGRLEGVSALGVDEHKMLAASRTRNTFFATSFVDVKSGRLLDVIPGRNADDVAYWCFGATPGWREEVAMVAIDPHRGYANGLVRGLPHAVVTVDHFHAIKLANEAVNDVRRRVQQETLGRRGHRDDPLYGVRRLMTRAHERLTERQHGRLRAALRAGDPDGEVGAAILGKELLRDVYSAADHLEARGRLQTFYDHVAWAEVRELTRLGKTVRSWEAEILSFHTTGISTGPVEAQNLVTEKLRRIGHGMRNFENYRLRLLLHSGVEWKASSTARIRGRHPRLVA